MHVNACTQEVRALYCDVINNLTEMTDRNLIWIVNAVAVSLRFNRINNALNIFTKDLIYI